VTVISHTHTQCVGNTAVPTFSSSHCYDNIEFTLPNHQFSNISIIGTSDSEIPETALIFLRICILSLTLYSTNRP